MTELSQPRPEPAMSPRNRRLAAFAVVGLAVLMFVGGMVAWVVDFRHDTICPDGQPWISRTDQGMGRITYYCGDGVTVTQGLIPK